MALSAGLPEENYQVQIAIAVKNAVGEAVVQTVILKVSASDVYFIYEGLFVLIKEDIPV